MYPYIGTNMLLYDLEERRRQAALGWRTHSSRRSHGRLTRGLRWAVGSALLRLGAVVSGDDTPVDISAASGG